MIEKELNRASFNIESSNSQTETEEIKSAPFSIDKDQRFLRKLKNKKYHYARRQLEKAHRSGKVTDEKRQQLVELLNRQASLELGHEVIRKPNWKAYKKIDEVEWSTDSEPTVERIAQLATGEIVIAGEYMEDDEHRSKISIWDEELTTELATIECNAYTNELQPLQNGQLLFRNTSGELYSIDPLKDNEPYLLTWCTQFATNGTDTIYCVEGRSVFVRKMETSQEEPDPLVACRTKIMKMIYDPSGRLVILEEDGNVKVVDLKENGALPMDIPRLTTRDIAIRKDAVYLLYGNEILVQKGTDRIPSEFILQKPGMLEFDRIDITPDNETLIIYHDGGTITLYEAETAKSIRTFEHCGGETIILDDNRILGHKGEMLEVWGES